MMEDEEMYSTLLMTSGLLLGWAAALKARDSRRPAEVIAAEMEEYGRKLYAELFGAAPAEKYLGKTSEESP